MRIFNATVDSRFNDFEGTEKKVVKSRVLQGSRYIERYFEGFINAGAKNFRR
jgi:hypothetical protein